MNRLVYVFMMGFGAALFLTTGNLVSLVCFIIACIFAYTEDED